jgi:hypothetical protein
MFRSAKYLAFVRRRPCIHCGSTCDHAHHFGKRWGGGGTGVKPHDTFTVPLCWSCHRAVHDTGKLGTWSKAETDSRMALEALRIVTDYLVEHEQAT